MRKTTVRPGNRATANLEPPHLQPYNLMFSIIFFNIKVTT